MERKLGKSCKENSTPLMSYMKSVLGNKSSVEPFKVQLKEENGDIVMQRGKPVIKMISDNKGMANE